MAEQCWACGRTDGPHDLGCVQALYFDDEDQLRAEHYRRLRAFVKKHGARCEACRGNGAVCAVHEIDDACPSAMPCDICAGSGLVLKVQRLC